MGIDTLKLADEIRLWLNRRHNSQVVIRLDFPTSRESLP
jgi:hypothetical protein